MDRKRLVELSIEALERKKIEIDEEIDILRTELGSSGKAVRQAASPVSAAGGRKRRSRTPAERRAQSQRMKQYWAQRNSKAPKAPAAAKKAPAGKVRVWTDSEKKALGLRMREVWKKRKSGSEKKTKK